MDLKEWVEENLLTAKKDKLSGKRINEKWMRDRGFDKQYEALIGINPDFKLACKIVVGWTGICQMCPNIVVLPAKCCSYKCSVNSPEWKEKKRETMIERYGVENAFEKGKLRNEFEEKNLERYGVRFPIASEEVRNKAKATCLENYGVEYSLQSDVIQDKIKNTLIERYGVENPCDVPGVREKIEATNLERYGVRTTTQNEEVKKRIVESNLRKYGVEHPAKTEWFQENKKKTNLEKYGVEYTSQNEEVKRKTRETNFLKYGASVFKRSHYTTELSEAIEKGLPDITGANDPIFSCVKSQATIHKLIRENRPDLVAEKGSQLQTELLEFIKNNTIHEVLENQYGIIGRSEIDIYIPELKLGFEYNSSYWHSTEFKSKNYHQNKSIKAKEKGVILVHLYEFDGFEKNKEIILEHLNGTYKPEVIHKNGMKYSKLDRGSTNNYTIGYDLGEPIFQLGEHQIYGAGYEILNDN